VSIDVQEIVLVGSLHTLRPIFRPFKTRVRLVALQDEAAFTWSKLRIGFLALNVSSKRLFLYHSFFLFISGSIFLRHLVEPQESYLARLSLKEIRDLIVGHPVPHVINHVTCRDFVLLDFISPMRMDENHGPFYFCLNGPHILKLLDQFSKAFGVSDRTMAGYELVYQNVVSDGEGTTGSIWELVLIDHRLPVVVELVESVDLDDVTLVQLLGHVRVFSFHVATFEKLLSRVQLNARLIRIVRTNF